MTIPNHYMWLYKDKTILYMVKWVEGKLLQKQRSFFELQVDFAVILCDELHDLPAWYAGVQAADGKLWGLRMGWGVISTEFFCW